jgi:methyl-accepting chemotaxis protein
MAKITKEAFAMVAAGTRKVDEIAAASQERFQGIEQINKAVAEMDRVVQQNAASAEESASASQEMNSQAEQMKGFVSQLLALVEGRNGNRIRSSEFGVQSSEILQKQRTGAGLRRVVKKPFKNEDVKKTVIHSKAMEVRPEKVIPLEEGDFKEF